MCCPCTNRWLVCVTVVNCFVPSSPILAAPVLCLPCPFPPLHTTFQPLFSVSPPLPFSYLAQHAGRRLGTSLTYRVQILAPVHGCFWAQPINHPSTLETIRAWIPLAKRSPLGIVHSLPTSSDTHLAVFPIRLEQIRTLHNLRASVAPDLHCRESPGQLARPTHLSLCSSRNYISTQDCSTLIESTPRPCFSLLLHPSLTFTIGTCTPPTRQPQLRLARVRGLGISSPIPSRPVPSSSPTVARGFLFPPEITHLSTCLCVYVWLTEARDQIQPRRPG